MGRSIILILSLTASSKHERQRFLVLLKIPSAERTISERASSVNVLWPNPALSSSLSIKFIISSEFNLSMVVEQVILLLISSFTFKAILPSNSGCPTKSSLILLKVCISIR